MIVSRRVYGKAPTGSCVVRLLLSLVATTPENIQLIEAVINVQTRLTSGSLHNKMQLTLLATRPTPHGASRLVRAMPA